MMTDPSSWLVQEVSDLLETSSVGLYEFIWILRGKYPDVGEEELRSWAANALRQLLEERRGAACATTVALGGRGRIGLGSRTFERRLERPRERKAISSYNA
jgi:hypothetical protein